MPLIPVAHLPSSVRQALRRGFPRRASRLVPCRGVDAIQDLLSHELVDAVVVNADLTAPERLFRLSRQYPRIPFFAWGGFRPDAGALVAACYRAGLSGVFVAEVDDAVAGELLARRTASAARRRLLADAPARLRLTEPIQRRAFEEVLWRAGAPVVTADVARTLRRSREHLSREFAAGGAPNLKRVIDLLRTVCAADLLGNPGYTVADVAAILRFSSVGHLALAADRIAGVRPAELAGLGPRGVFERFLKGRTRSRI